MSIQTITKEDMVRLAQAEARTKFAESLPVGKDPFVKVAPVATGLTLNASGKTAVEASPEKYRTEFPVVDVAAKLVAIRADIAGILKQLDIMELSDGDEDVLTAFTGIIAVKAERIAANATAVKNRNLPVKVKIA